MIPTFAQLNLINFNWDNLPEGLNVEENSAEHKACIKNGLVPNGKIPVLKVTHQKETVYIPTITVGLPKK